MTPLSLVAFVIMTEGMNIPSALQHAIMNTFLALNLQLIHGYLWFPLMPILFLVCLIVNQFNPC